MCISRGPAVSRLEHRWREPTTLDSERVHLHLTSRYVLDAHLPLEPTGVLVRQTWPPKMDD